MRILCVACDEAMQLTRTAGPEEGSMTVLFTCSSCGNEVAMLTNSMETQVVRSLGVKIGGRTVPAEPMEQLRSTLVHRREEATQAPEPQPVQETVSTSKCPFTGMVEEAFSEKGPSWSSEAEARIERIPIFARPIVKKGIEDFARSKGYDEISVSVMDEVKVQFGM